MIYLKIKQMTCFYFIFLVKILNTNLMNGVRTGEWFVPLAVPLCICSYSVMLTKRTYQTKSKAAKAVAKQTARSKALYAVERDRLM